MTSQQRAPHRSGVVVVAGVLLAAVAAMLAVVGGAGQASAETETFRPEQPRRYLQSVTVRGLPRQWQIDVRTKNADQVIGYELYIDIGGGEQGPGADYILQSVLGTTRLYESTDGTRGESRPAGCTGKKSLPLRGDQGPGRRFVLPARCLTYFATDDSQVGRLRVRAAAIGTPPGQDCRYSWSPRAGKLVFHRWVNRPTPEIEPRATQRTQRTERTARAASTRATAPTTLLRPGC